MQQVESMITVEHMARLVALVGLPGAGKSVATDVFVDNNFQKIYFGGLTLEKLREEGLEINEANERMMREKLRQEHGMAVYAILNIPNIEAALEKGDVIIDGLYSWEEYLVLREKFPNLEVVAIYAPPKDRYKRLSVRRERGLTEEEVKSREVAEIEKLHKGGPIAIADWTVVNIGSEEELKKQVRAYIDGK